MRNIWMYGRVAVIGLAVIAMVTTGSADARRGGVGKTVEGSEVTDGTLTGADVDETTLQCGGPGGIPGCGAATPGTPSSPTVTFAPSASAQIGYPAIKLALVKSDCPAGTHVVGGSVSWDNDQDDDDVYFRESGFTGPNSWYAIAVDGPVNNHPITARVTAICIS